MSINLFKHIYSFISIQQLSFASRQHLLRHLQDLVVFAHLGEVGVDEAVGALRELLAVVRFGESKDSQRVGWMKLPTQILRAAGDYVGQLQHVGRRQQFLSIYLVDLDLSRVNEVDERLQDAMVDRVELHDFLLLRGILWFIH